MEEGETNVTRGFKVSGMPLKQWKQWEKDAVESFGNCYWLKIWADHEKAKQFDVVVGQIMRKFEEYDQIFEDLEVKDEEKSVSTLGR